MILPRGRLVRAADLGRTTQAARRADELADAAALMIRASSRAAEADERNLDRLIDLSRLLAERLLGSALALRPEAIVSLARSVLEEARSARRVHVFVNPAHVSDIEGATLAFDPERRIHAVSADTALGPGDVRLETELGTVEARIDPELERLAHRLRDALRS
jgi:flagellar biosynthesis/type III secretory pathway protein FliH